MSITTAENGTWDDLQFPTRWLTAGSKRHSNNSNSSSEDLLQTSLPVAVTNRYVALYSLSEPPLSRVETVSEEAARKPTITSNNTKMTKNQRGANYLQNKHHTKYRVSKALQQPTVVMEMNL
jgi:hypothetical protein